MSHSDLSMLPTEVIRSELCEIVETQLNSNKYKINVNTASQIGENNFIGIVYRVSFCNENEDEHGENVSKLILKVAPQGEQRRSGGGLPIRDFFLREIFMYNVVIIKTSVKILEKSSFIF